MLHKREALNYIPRTHTKMLVMALHAFNPKETGGLQGLACLPALMNWCASGRQEVNSVSADTGSYSLNFKSTHTNTQVPAFRRRGWGNEIAQGVKVLAVKT